MDQPGRRTILTAAISTAAAAIVATGTAGATGGAHHRSLSGYAPEAGSTLVTDLRLTPSSPQLAACMPGARLKVTNVSTTEKLGFDKFKIRARDLPPDRDYTVFLLEQAGAPFGAAQYLGDFTTNKNGNADNTFKAIVDEAFASTIVNGQRVRVDLNQVGVWFADPAADDFCLGAGQGPVTPFDGDDEAGIQAFNSASTSPLPAP